MQAGLLNAYDSVKAFSETDFTEDLKKFDVPTLVLHGEDDQIVPVKDSAVKSARLIKGAKDVYYPGAPHGITATHQDQINGELLRVPAELAGTSPRPDDGRRLMKYRDHRRNRPHRVEARHSPAPAGPPGGAGVSGDGRQHPHRARGWPRSSPAPPSSSTCRTRPRSKTRRC